MLDSRRLLIDGKEGYFIFVSPYGFESDYLSPQMSLDRLKAEFRSVQGEKRTALAYRLWSEERENPAIHHLVSGWWSEWSEDVGRLAVALMEKLLLDPVVRKERCPIPAPRL